MAGIGEEVGRLLDALGVDRAAWAEGSMPSHGNCDQGTAPNTTVGAQTGIMSVS